MDPFLCYLLGRAAGAASHGGAGGDHAATGFSSMVAGYGGGLTGAETHSGSGATHGVNGLTPRGGCGGGRLIGAASHCGSEAIHEVNGLTPRGAGRGGRMASSHPVLNRSSEIAAMPVGERPERSPPAFPTTQNGTHSEWVRINPLHIRFLMGRRGKTVRGIEGATTTSIRIRPGESGEVVVTGSRTGVQRALLEIDRVEKYAMKVLSAKSKTQGSSGGGNSEGLDTVNNGTSS